jgi:hypothetical protein
MRRFTKTDYMAFCDATPIPSGEPMYGEVSFPLPDGTDGTDELRLLASILVSGDDEGIAVCLFGGNETDHPIMVGGHRIHPGHCWSAEWVFPCERDAMALANLIEGRSVSLEALEVMGGRWSPC